MKTVFEKHFVSLSVIMALDRQIDVETDRHKEVVLVFLGCRQFLRLGNGPLRIVHFLERLSNFSRSEAPPEPVFEPKYRFDAYFCVCPSHCLFI